MGLHCITEQKRNTGSNWVLSDLHIIQFYSLSTNLLGIMIDQEKDFDIHYTRSEGYEKTVTPLLMADDNIEEDQEYKQQNSSSFGTKNSCSNPGQVAVISHSLFPLCK